MPRRGPLRGRRAIVQSVEGLLASSQKGVVHLYGAAGVGKTRIAEEVMNRARARGTPVGHVEFGLEASRVALDDPRADRDVRAALQTGNGLVVLDGLEEPESKVRAWVDSCPGVRWLVVSRHPATPALPQPILLGPLEPRPSRELFLDWAHEHAPGLIAQTQAAALIDDIVDALEGIPKAIELAAERLRFLSLEALLARLETPCGGDPEGPLARDARACWARLSADERRILAQCALFRGPFDLGAIESTVVPR